MRMTAKLLNSEGNVLLLLPILLLLPLLYFVLKQIKATQLPPGPTPWPILGNIPHMGKLPHATLANLARAYGPLVSLRLGTQCVVVASSSKSAMEILKTNDRILSTRYVPKAIPFKRAELEHSLVWGDPCNNTWKSLRALCRTELFSIKALNAQSCLRERKIMEMVQHLRAKEGELVNIGELVFVIGFNMLSNILLSKDIIGLDEETGGVKSAIRKMMELSAVPNISDFYPILTNLDLQSLHKNSVKLVGRMRSIWQPTIQAKRNGGASSEQDFLDVLLHANFTDDQIHQLFTELFTAGSDTSASTIEWAMAELIKSTESMRKLRQELDREFNQKTFLQEQSLMQLPYLQACVKETFRLHPPTPLLLPHLASEECQLMNYIVPKNARLFVNVWAIGRDPSVWDEPLRFKPERFLDSDVDFKGNDFEFLPFGAGRRICPGLPMAGRHIPLVLSSLVLFFDWSLPKGKDPRVLDMKEQFGITLQKEQPLLLIPKARQMMKTV